MKTLRPFMTVAIMGTLSAIGCAHGGESTPGDRNSSASPYRAQELSIDGFACGSIGQQTIDHLSGNAVEHNGRLGAGGGLNYFPTRCIGIGGDAYSENTADHFIDNASGNLIARLPLGQTGVAPYIFGGGGYQFDEVSQRFAQGGAASNSVSCSTPASSLMPVMCSPTRPTITGWDARGCGSISESLRS